MKYTNRGFAIYTELKDSYGADIRVQVSSAASGRYCWIFAQGGATLSTRQKLLSEEPKERPGNEIVNDSVSPHLSPEQARQLAMALLEFANEES